jgi:prephenate dehydrogenase/chorismate mutase
MKLSKARQELSEKIAAAKLSGNIPIEDKKLESDLVDSIEEYAKSIQLDPKLARELASNLIESSKRVQRRRIHLSEIKFLLKRKKINSVSIVGAGRMGCWFATYFSALGRRVILFDSKTETAKARAHELGCAFARSKNDTLGSELIILAVPISEMGREIDFFTRQSKSDKKNDRLIIEISSVKEQVLSDHIEYDQLISIHPLFGSSSDLFSANSVIVVKPPTSISNYRLIKDLFPHFNTIAMNASDHDRLMGVMLSLPHALIFMFGDLVAKKVTQSPKGIASPSFENFLQMWESVLSENPRVYFDIQSMNKHSREILRSIERSSSKFRKLVTGGDYKGFRKLLDDARNRCPTR